MTTNDPGPEQSDSGTGAVPTPPPPPLLPLPRHRPLLLPRRRQPRPTRRLPAQPRTGRHQPSLASPLRSRATRPCGRCSRT